MFGKSQEIADLQAAVASVTAERDQLATATADMRSAIEAAAAERDAALALVESTKATAAAELLAANEAAATATAARIAEIEAAATTRIEAEVITRLASAGVDPIERDPDASSENQTISRAEFKKLKPNEKATFCAKGGKIQD